MSVTNEYYGVPERMLPTVATIGGNIRRLRKAAGFKTGKAFAEKLGVPAPRVSEWEKNRYALPDTATLISIAKVVKQPVDEILRGIDPQLDRIMGTARVRSTGEPLTDAELQLVIDFAEIDDDDKRETVLNTVRHYAGRPASGANEASVASPRVRDALEEVAAASAAEIAKQKRQVKPPRQKARRG